jgi:hypothetical protein
MTGLRDTIESIIGPLIIMYSILTVPKAGTLLLGITSTFLGSQNNKYSIEVREKLRQDSFSLNKLWPYVFNPSSNLFHFPTKVDEIIEQTLQTLNPIDDRYNIGDEYNK